MNARIGGRYVGDRPKKFYESIAEALEKRVGLQINWLPLDTSNLVRELSFTRQVISLWKPDINCFYGGELTRKRLKDAIKQTREEKSYAVRYAPDVHQALIESRRRASKKHGGIAYLKKTTKLKGRKAD